MLKLIEQENYSIELGLGEFNDPVIMLRDEKGEYFSIAHMCTTSYDPKVVRANTQLFQYALDMYRFLCKLLEEKKCNAKELSELLQRIQDTSGEDDNEANNKEAEQEAADEGKSK